LVTPGRGSSQSSFQARCSCAPGHAHSCCHTVSATGLRSARRHVAWQGQLHRVMVDTSRRRDTTALR
jgi:hypothetical protein